MSVVCTTIRRDKSLSDWACASIRLPLSEKAKGALEDLLEWDAGVCPHAATVRKVAAKRRGTVLRISSPITIVFKSAIIRKRGGTVTAA